MTIGNIDIGNITTLATFNEDLGKKCFAFTKLDAGEIVRIKKAAFWAMAVKKGAK